MDASDEVVAPRRARVRIGIGAAAVLVVVGLGIAILVSAFGSHGNTSTVARPTVSPPVPTGVAGVQDANPGAGIYVHVLGAVASPGLFLLKDGDRAVDAVSAAGGFTATADQAQLNLARRLVDGEQIYVPNVGESAPAAAGGGAAAQPPGKVNLNTADEATLETLPRVGPAMAKRILDWRKTNGRFSSIEDLMGVTGVGDKTFEGLKDLITV
ncbi:helix-hairpin-helix domain-containing protein [Lacisediminihabitans sp.]|uniref:helix-hairpin-helix domain-containing protein n=1 Tax=Lacisediminihabitans sp. TaxID=2787631 RepID=UPI00374CE0DC